MGILEHSEQTFEEMIEYVVDHLNRGEQSVGIVLYGFWDAFFSEFDIQKALHDEGFMCRCEIVASADDITEMSITRDPVH